MNAHAKYQAQLDQLHTIHHWIRENLRSCGLDEINILKVELACEETLVNIILHGYKGSDGIIELDIRGGDKVEIEFRDAAPSFNPLEKEVGFDPLATLEERKIGGLGIMMIRQYVDDLRYERKDGKNILTLIKRIKP